MGAFNSSKLRKRLGSDRSENTAFGQIIVTKGNPSRGKGFEVAHFIRRNGSVRSLSELDVFLPSIPQAAAWVRRYYPNARLVTRRKNHFGRLAGLAFECDLKEMRPGCRAAKRARTFLLDDGRGGRKTTKAELNAENSQVIAGG
jgi:hypothetical protein